MEWINQIVELIEKLIKGIFNFIVGILMLGLIFGDAYWGLMPLKVGIITVNNL